MRISVPVTRHKPKAVPRVSGRVAAGSAALSPRPLPGQPAPAALHRRLGRVLLRSSPVRGIRSCCSSALPGDLEASSARAHGQAERPRSCLPEQSIGTENPKHRATCHLAFPQVSFHFLNYLIDKPFLFIHPRSAGFHSNNQTWNPKLRILSE